MSLVKHITKEYLVPVVVIVAISAAIIDGLLLIAL